MNDIRHMNIRYLQTTGSACFKSNPAGASIKIDGSPVTQVTISSSSVCDATNSIAGLTVGRMR